MNQYFNKIYSVYNNNLYLTLKIDNLNIYVNIYVCEKHQQFSINRT